MNPRRSLALLLLALPLVRGAAWAGPEDAAVAAAEKALQNPDWQARLKAVGSLEALTTPKAERVVLGFLKDTDWMVQIRACAAAGKIGHDAAEDALIDLVLGGEIHRVREAAIAALKQLNAAEAG